MMVLHFFNATSLHARSSDVRSYLKTLIGALSSPAALVARMQARPTIPTTGSLSAH
jgi:hypothetical protein